MCCMLANMVALVTLFSHSVCFGHSGKSLHSVSSHILEVGFDIVTLEDTVSTQIMETWTLTSCIIVSQYYYYYY